MNRAAFLFSLVLVFGVARPGVSESPISFELDIQPILTARGCNAGACHGKARGQNGFQLSLLGFDADFDHGALTREARGRRLFPASPRQSLLLRKATGQTPHGGGRRLDADGRDYQTLLAWVEQGARRRLENEPHLQSISLSPQQQQLRPRQTERFRVTAHYSDGSTRDVTGRTAFQANEPAIVSVDDAGEFTAGDLPGEAAIMARYMDQIAVCRVLIPLPGNVPDQVYQQLPRNNFIDDLVWRKLKSLGLTPSPPATESTFLRRVYLDIIGRTPTPEEAREFLDDSREDKRARLVDRLLERPEYADRWANYWADLLRPNPYRVGIKAVLSYDNWIRERFRRNQPYDQFVRELVSAEGSTWTNGATVLFRDRRSPDEIATLVSQLFLGVRLECAKCHHHPFEKWSQHDFYSFSAYFAKIGRKGRGLSPPISGSEEIVMLGKKGDVKHPLSGEVLAPAPLFGEAANIEDGQDPRKALAEWIVSPKNHYFSEVIVNRVWSELMGRGIVEPVDDLRTSNPPSNGPLLKALAEEFRKQKYDLKQLIRTICLSQVYSLSSQPNDRNISDLRNYSRHYRRRLRAETLLDSVCDITGVPEKFSAMPAGSRASQIWTHRVSSLFLDTFGRPNPNEDPPCERSGESTVTQSLHLMNSPALQDKILSNSGRAALWAKSEKAPEHIVEELYLWIYCRYPDQQEKEIAKRWFEKEGVTKRAAIEDLMWALLNTPEFVFLD